MSNLSTDGYLWRAVTERIDWGDDNDEMAPGNTVFEGMAAGAEWSLTLLVTPNEAMVFNDDGGCHFRECHDGVEMGRRMAERCARGVVLARVMDALEASKRNG